MKKNENTEKGDPKKRPSTASGNKKISKDGKIKDQEVTPYVDTENLIIDTEMKVDVSQENVEWDYKTITFREGGSITVSGTNAFTIRCTEMIKE